MSDKVQNYIDRRSVLKWLPIRNRQFGKIWLAQILSQFGTRMYQIGISWWIVQQAGGSQGIQLGILFFLSAVPALAFVKYIGRIVDTESPSTLLGWSEFFSGIFVLSLLLFMPNQGPLLTMIYIAGFVLAFFQAIVDPTLLKGASQIVLKDDVEEAVGLITTTATVAGVFGAFLGAAAIDWLGLPGLVILNSLSYIISATLVYSTNFQNQALSSKMATNEPGQDVNSKPRDALSLNKQNKYNIDYILWTFAGMNFFTIPTLLVIPLYVNQVLKGSGSLLAIMEAGLALGLVLGSVISRFIKTGFAPIKLLFFCSLCFGLMLLPPLFWSVDSCYFMALLLCGFAMGLLNVKIITYFESVVDRDEQGKFFAKLNAITSTAIPISHLTFGFLSDYFSLNLIIFIQSSGIILISMRFVYLYFSQRNKENAWV